MQDLKFELGRIRVDLHLKRIFDKAAKYFICLDILFAKKKF